MDIVCREMEIGKNQIEMLEIKYMNRNKSPLLMDLLSRLSMTGERIFELEELTIETSQTETQKEKNQPPPKKRNVRIVRQLQKMYT